MCDKILNVFKNLALYIDSFLIRTSKKTVYNYYTYFSEKC